MWVVYIINIKLLNTARHKIDIYLEECWYIVKKNKYRYDMKGFLFCFYYFFRFIHKSLGLTKISVGGIYGKSFVISICPKALWKPPGELILENKSGSTRAMLEGFVPAELNVVRNVYDMTPASKHVRKISTSRVGGQTASLSGRDS